MRLKMIRSTKFLAAALVCIFAATVSATVIEDYGYVDTFTLPQIGQGSYGTMVDVLADGRLISVTGNEVYLESAVGSRTFDSVATFDTSVATSVDPAFIRVSPSGGTIAVGMGYGKPIAVFGASDLGTPGSPVVLTNAASGGSTKYFSLAHYDAEWADDSTLAINAGDYVSSSASLLDVGSDPASPQVAVVVGNIPGASGGITFDSDGALYTGIGYGTDTGLIRRFSAADIASALSTGTPLDFSTNGLEVVQALSAASLGFDMYGDFYVGGGNWLGGGQQGYFALLDANALDDIIAGNPFTAADYLDPSKWAKFDPEGSGTVSSYMVNYNDTTGELMGLWQSGWGPGDKVFAGVYSVPVPSALILASLGSALAIAVKTRKQKRARDA